jgi:hypothetical protein
MEQFLTPYLQQQALQNQSIAEQGREFDVSTAEGKRQFDLQQAMQTQAADRAYQIANARQQQSEAAMRADAWKSSMAGLDKPWSGNIFDPQMQAMYEQKFQQGDAANGIKNAYSMGQQGGQDQGGDGSTGNAPAGGRDATPAGFPGFVGGYFNPNNPNSGGPGYQGGGATIPYSTPLGQDFNNNMQNIQNTPSNNQPYWNQGGATPPSQGGYDFSGAYGNAGASGNMAGIGLVKDPGSFMSNMGGQGNMAI